MSAALLTVSELAALLKVSRASIYRALDDGLPAVRLGPRTLRFREDAVMAWLDGRAA